MSELKINDDIKKLFLRTTIERGDDAGDIVDSFMLNYILDNSIRKAKQKIEIEKTRQFLKRLKHNLNHN